jgi:aspartate/tyrosine/aromatic aminotransferase
LPAAGKFCSNLHQGFATGSIDADAAAPRLFVDKGMEIIVAQSYSKNLGLYGERVGACVVVSTSNEIAARILSQVWNPPPSSPSSAQAGMLD